MKYEAPELTEYVTIPVLQEGAMAHSSPFVAKPKHQEDLGFPGELVDDWHDRAIAKMGELKKTSRSFGLFLDICVHCGACTDKCHYFLGTGDPKNMPVARQELLRSVYRRNFTFAGKNFPKLVGARDLTREVLDEWHSYFHQCSECRRCSVYCPYGIDTAEITMAARDILDEVGYGQKYDNEILGKVMTIGNNLGLPAPALAATLEDLEEDLEDETGLPIKMPLDVKGADILLITPSADFFAEPHIDGLLGYAKVFHQAGVSWTMSSYASEGANFGMFIGSYKTTKKVAERIRKAALDLGVKRVIVGECGHAWRVAYSFWNTLSGTGHGAAADDEFAQKLQKQLDPRYPAPQHIVEFTYDMLQRGELKLDKSANDHRTVTFHDSCNVARGTGMGGIERGQFILPREVIKAVVNNYVEMDESTMYEEALCCGGGGGLLTDDLMELRIKGAMPRMNALDKVHREEKVNTLAAICAICKSQFSKVLPYYDMPMDMIISVHQLVGDALVFDNVPDKIDESESEVGSAEESDS
ncbi:MAG: (Fe-S)-binding protein [Thiotrichales bacterium]|nr:(Fe-S)-binding protein [Thiotrichales bacterium]